MARLRICNGAALLQPAAQTTSFFKFNAMRASNEYAKNPRHQDPDAQWPEEEWRRPGAQLFSLSRSLPHIPQPEFAKSTMKTIACQEQVQLMGMALGKLCSQPPVPPCYPPLHPAPLEP